MNNIPCYLIPFLVGAICAFLGYLLGKTFSNQIDNSNELSLQAQLDACLAETKRNNSFAGDLQTSKVSKSISETTEIPNQFNDLNSYIKAESIISTESEHFDATAVATIMGKKWKKDDLKIVEGIGPKIEELYHEAGINTWIALSETNIETSQKILDNAGDKFKMHNPGSWAKQAKMAATGDWENLKKWQNEHKGGKE